MSDGEMTFNCGSTIIDECVGTTKLFTGTNKNIQDQWQNLVTEIIDVGMALQTYGFMILSEGSSENIMNAMIAFKCATQSGFVNIWKLGAAAFFAARTFE